MMMALASLPVAAAAQTYGPYAQESYVLCKPPGSYNEVVVMFHGGGWAGGRRSRRGSRAAWVERVWLSFIKASCPSVGAIWVSGRRLQLGGF